MFHYSVDRKSNNYTHPSGAQINRTQKMKHIHNHNVTDANDVLRASHNIEQAFEIIRWQQR